jgi:hypothetical protein
LSYIDENIITIFYRDNIYICQSHQKRVEDIKKEKVPKEDVVVVIKKEVIRLKNFP